MGTSSRSTLDVLANVERSELGRYAITGRSEDTGAFKTPSLRNVALTAPYMHDGRLSSLDEVVEFFDAGGVDNSNPHLPASTAAFTQYRSGLVRPLGLTRYQKRDLVEFMRSLTSRQQDLDSLELDASRIAETP